MQDRGLPLTSQSLTAAVYALCCRSPSSSPSSPSPPRPEAAEALMAEMEGTGQVAPDAWTWYVCVCVCVVLNFEVVFGGGSFF